jgi:hypothetical protein
MSYKPQKNDCIPKELIKDEAMLKRIFSSSNDTHCYEDAVYGKWEDRHRWVGLEFIVDPSRWVWSNMRECKIINADTLSELLNEEKIKPGTWVEVNGLVFVSNSEWKAVWLVGYTDKNIPVIQNDGVTYTIPSHNKYKMRVLQTQEEKVESWLTENDFDLTSDNVKIATLLLPKAEE